MEIRHYILSIRLKLTGYVEPVRFFSSYDKEEQNGFEIKFMRIFSSVCCYQNGG